MVHEEYTDAMTLTERLFPDVDRESAEYLYYQALNRIAAAIAEYRYDQHLTQTDLAKHLGVTQAMVSKYESGEYNFSLKTLFELLDKLNLKLSWSIYEREQTALTSGMSESFRQTKTDDSLIRADNSETLIA